MAENIPHTGHDHIDPAEARAAVNTADQARTTSGAANALPLAALLLATGSAMTAASLTMAGDVEAGGEPTFMVRMLLALALLIPGFIVYSVASSWSRTDTAILATTLALQIGGFIAGAAAASMLDAPIWAHLAAAGIIVATSVVMFITRSRVRRDA